MPGKVRYHDIVKQALLKDGWLIKREQYFVKFYARHLWIDLEGQAFLPPVGNNSFNSFAIQDSG